MNYLLPLLCFVCLSLTACNTQKAAASATAKTGKILDLPAAPPASIINGDQFVITEVSEDPTYGSMSNPIRVGGQSPSNERRFLNALYGPTGQDLSYVRQGSCCHFKTKNGLFNDGALLDIYEVTWEGNDQPVLIYIDMYDYAPLKAPQGFSLKASNKM